MEAITPTITSAASCRTSRRIPFRSLPVRTSQEDADTGGTTAGSVMLTTKSGTNDWHGDAAFYERAAALNARFPIENPAPNPKQPFSRQNYVGTLGGPIIKRASFGSSRHLKAFTKTRASPTVRQAPRNSMRWPRWLQKGLIPGVSSIDVPANVPIPFRDYFGSERLDWAQSTKSQWYLRGSTDSYTTHNDLVQQGTLPSTGLLTHNNYFSLVIANQYAFTPTLLGKILFNASGLHLTQTRNSDLGLCSGISVQFHIVDGLRL